MSVGEMAGLGVSFSFFLGAVASMIIFADHNTGPDYRDRAGEQRHGGVGYGGLPPTLAERERK